MFFIILLFPIAELYTFIAFVDRYSFLDGLLGLILSAVIGFFLLRVQGKSALIDLQSEMIKNPENLSNSLLLKALGFLSAILFIIPGFLSDIVAFALLLPGSRHLIAWLIKRQIKKSKFQMGKQNPFNNNFAFRFYSTSNTANPQDYPQRNEDQRFENARDVTLDAQVIEIQHTSAAQNKKTNE